MYTYEVYERLARVTLTHLVAPLLSMLVLDEKEDVATYYAMQRMWRMAALCVRRLDSGT